MTQMMDKKSSLKDESALIAQMRIGNHNAFKAIYEHYSPRLFGFIRKYIHIKEDSEEILQLVFLKIWENHEKIADYPSLQGFLFTVARNEVFSSLRSQVCRKTFENWYTTKHVDEDSSLLEDLYGKELNAFFEELIAQLPPRRREVFTLSRVEGLTYKQIADKLGISENTVDVQLRKALDSIRDALNSEFVISIILLFIVLYQ